jgi:hypothetical protein
VAIGNGNGASPATTSTPTPPLPKPSGDEDGFTKVLTKEERRKLRKVEKHKPQFQFDVGQFRSGKKIGIAHVRDFVMYLLVDGVKPQWIVAEVSVVRCGRVRAACGPCPRGARREAERAKADDTRRGGNEA